MTSTPISQAVAKRDNSPAALISAAKYAASLKDPQKQADYLNDFLATTRQRLEDAGASGPE